MLRDVKLEQIKGVGQKRAESFRTLGVDSVDALLHYYPRAYEDWSNITPIFGAELSDEKVCIRATVVTAASRFRAKSGIWVFEAKAADATGTMKILIFNNKYAAAKLVKGRELLFYGKVTVDYGTREMLSPAIEEVADKDRIRPIYKSTKNLSSKMIESAAEKAVAGYSFLIEEFIPQWIIDREKLMPLAEAIREIHFPTSMENMAKARNRLIFDELFLLQLGMQKIAESNRAPSDVIVRNDCSDEFYRMLPFEPTGAQRRAVTAAVDDMKKGVLMNRLVQGDVGSGKTMVAAACCYVVIKNGYQCALMAPTEILAGQHYATMAKFFEGTGVRIELLTGSTGAKEKQRMKDELRHGEIDFIIGTHALITDDIMFDSLGLVITDEQHRFGVRQRGSLAEKGEGAHVLVMSATPIPRTLALAIYGDLDISVIDELPKGRQPVETYRIDSGKRQRAFAYIRKFLDEGRQGYIVCPLVEENEADGLDEGLASAVEYYDKISKKEFKNYSVGLLHGKMKSSEKAAVMKSFLSGDIQLLVATVVIEVGVDVPNAVIMLIENAERFGLAQLHQLRGRVGRGNCQSTCILLSDSKSENTNERLKVMCRTTDGFEISRSDLSLRGPGDFFGNRQHGLPELRLADMMEDMSVLERAGAIANIVHSEDPYLQLPENKALSEAVDRLFEGNLSTC